MSKMGGRQGGGSPRRIGGRRQERKGWEVGVLRRREAFIKH